MNIENFINYKNFSSSPVERMAKSFINVPLKDENFETRKITMKETKVSLQDQFW